MSDFSGKTEDYLNTVITNNGFYPNVVLGDFQRDYNIPAKYEIETVTNKILLAMVNINDQLAVIQDDWELDGATTLAEVDTTEHNGVNKMEMHYIQAVFSRAKALLIPEFASLNRKDSAMSLDESTIDLAAPWKTLSNRAVRKLKGIETTITVELL